MHIDAKGMELSILKVVLILQTVLIQMKYSMMLHFTWVSIVCQSTHLGLSSIQRVNGKLASVKHILLFSEFCRKKI